MTDKLRAAALAAYKAMIAAELSDGSKREWDAAVDELTAALAEQKPMLEMNPEKRPWVGLTDEEITQGNRESLVDLQAWKEAVSWAEAKLREKNT